MRVALIIRDLFGGGAERSVLWLARGLIDRGHEVDIVLLRSRVHYPDEVPRRARLFVVDRSTDEVTQKSAAAALARMNRLNVPARSPRWRDMAGALAWRVSCLPGPRLARWTRGVASYLELRNPDCILPNSFGGEAATLLACRLAARPPPIVPTVRVVVTHDRSWRFRQRMRRDLYTDAACLVGVSRGVSDSLSSVLGVARDRIRTIYNPVPIPHPRRGMTPLHDHPWFLEGGDPVILSAGRFTAQKDFRTLVRAFALVTARRRSRLVILGEGKERKRLERLVRELGLEDRVSLPGWTDNPFPLMARAALFVVSSRYEGFSRVVVEALACGCPCVSTDCPSGPAEILRDGEVGPLVPVGDVRALAMAMLGVLERRPEQSLLRERAADFSVDRAAAEYETLLRSLRSPSRDGRAGRRERNAVHAGDPSEARK